MALIERLSPAKINFMLRVIGRRSDGYHLLQSCFQILSWGDDMRFIGLPEINNSIQLTGFADLPLRKNLIFQAAEKLRPYAGNSQSVRIEVNKRIPVGAGLGGGSSNAATTLRVLNELWDCRLADDKLIEIGLQLGADVPFFIVGKSALVTGIGEIIRPMSFYQGYLLLLFPEVAISTASVFNNAELNRNQTPLAGEFLSCPDFWINDCFPVVLKSYPAVAGLFQILSEYMHVRMSGTGSTLFALFKDEKQALKAQKTAKQHCRQALIKI